MDPPEIWCDERISLHRTRSRKGEFYQYLQECGYVLVFKQTISVGTAIKGNCDAELVLKAVSDFYTKTFDSCVLVTGDGDFGCLIEFLKEYSAIDHVIAPDKAKCSILIRNKNTNITFLNEHYHKFSKPAQEVKE